MGSHSCLKPLVTFWKLPPPSAAMGSKNGKPVLRDEDIAALSQSSGMPQQEVKDAFNAFVAEHPNGKMKPKDFREIMSSALPKKMPPRWRNMCSGSMIPIVMDMLTLLSSWSFSSSCLTGLQKRSCPRSSACLM